MTTRIPPSRRSRGGGVGLGLTLATPIIEAHGGTIDLESRARAKAPPYGLCFPRRRCLGNLAREAGTWSLPSTRQGRYPPAARRLAGSLQGPASRRWLAPRNAMTGAHAHGTPGCNCHEPQCKKAAVCRALGELLAGYEVPLGGPIRALAQGVFDLASALKRVSAEIEPRLLDAGLRLDEELTNRSGELRAARSRTNRQLRRRGLPPLPRRKKGQSGLFDVPHAHELLCLAPHAAAGELRGFTIGSFVLTKPFATR